MNRKKIVKEINSKIYKLKSDSSTNGNKIKMQNLKYIRNLVEEDIKLNSLKKLLNNIYSKDITNYILSNPNWKGFKIEKGKPKRYLETLEDNLYKEIEDTIDSLDNENLKANLLNKFYKYTSISTFNYFYVGMLSGVKLLIEYYFSPKSKFYLERFFKFKNI